MNILFITSYVPFPPISGGSLQTFLRLKHLKKRGHSVFLISLALKKDENSILELEDYIDGGGYIYAKPDYRKIWYLMRKSLLYEIFNYDSQFSRKLMRFANQNNIDIAVFEGLGVAQYRNAVLGIPSVLVEHNVEYEIIEHLVSALRKCPANVLKGSAGEKFKNIYLYLFGTREKELVTTYEMSSLRKFDLILTCSDRDGAILGNGSDRVPRITVPWCVEKPFVFDSQVHKDVWTLLFVGCMQWEPNRDAVRWFVKKMLPLLRKTGKECRLVIVGSGMSEEIQNLGNGKDITIKGYVPDISSVLSDADIFVAPIRFGSGMNVKVIEAMSYGLPVVTTSKGAEGIKGEDKKHFVLANTPEEFVHNIVYLIMNPEIRKSVGEAAKEYISRHHLTESVIEVLEHALYACHQRFNTSSGAPG